jgi:hypothetical protein
MRLFDTFSSAFVAVPSAVALEYLLSQKIFVPDQPTPDRFKPEMPRIPGVSAGAPNRAASKKPNLAVLGALAAALLVAAAAAHFAIRPRHADAPAAAETPQLQVPTPAPDPTASYPRATEAEPTVATVDEMTSPWSHKDFFFQDRLTGENLPALLLRLPSGSATQPTGYWSFVMRTAYGTCNLEFISDLNRLHRDYGFRAAQHAMIGDPCSRTVFDPEKMTMLPGNIWVRGAIVQGAGVRPPLGIELRIKDKKILAIRHE